MKIVEKINNFLAFFDITVRRKSKLNAELLKMSNIITESTPECLQHPFYILAQYQNLLQTMRSGKPEAADGNPLPWYTFPAIEFFKSLNVAGLKIFEYGCGNSSLFWARKGAKVWSVEDNLEWYECMLRQSAGLQNIMLRQDKPTYLGAIAEPEEKFEIIIIDGKWRRDCAQSVFKFLAPGGVVILDDSNRDRAVNSILQSGNLFEIAFNGFGPICGFCWTTSLFLPFNKHILSDRGSFPLPIGGISEQQSEIW